MNEPLRWAFRDRELDIVPILITRVLFERMCEALQRGPVRIDYGEPDERGLYTPTITTLKAEAA